jgi:putative N6-adenine-specific DNA methylase
MDFFDYKPVRDTEGVIISNPPYGERIGEEIEEMYKKIGDHLKQNFKNQSVWLLSSNKAALKQIGLQTEERIALFNGSLDCEYCNYSIY